MTQEEKELLLKDLCARLPYSVMLYVEGYDTQKLIGIENETITTKAPPTAYSDKGEFPIDIVKPYFRSMSSMTEEEKKEYNKFFPLLPRDLMPPRIALQMFNWLLKKHFDFMGLIPKGLAIEVTEENNPYKE